jgi:hypothetical protein
VFLPVNFGRCAFYTIRSGLTILRTQEAVFLNDQAGKQLA